QLTADGPVAAGAHHDVSPAVRGQGSEGIQGAFTEQVIPAGLGEVVDFVAGGVLGEESPAGLRVEPDGGPPPPVARPLVPLAHPVVKPATGAVVEAPVEVGVVTGDADGDSDEVGGLRPDGVRRRDAVAGRAPHGHLAVAPLLPGAPLDGVVAVVDLVLKS